MDTLLHKFNKIVNGVIKGFDRIVFKGYIRPILYEAGMQMFLKNRGFLNKDYKDWVQAQSKDIVKSASGVVTSLA